MKNLILLLIMIVIFFTAHVLSGQAMLKVQIKDGKIVKTEKVTDDKPQEVKPQKSETVLKQSSIPKSSRQNSVAYKKNLLDDFDLVVRELFLGNGGGPNIHYTVRVGNDGTSGIIPINAVVIKSYLSIDNIITTDDFIIQYLSNTVELGPGQTNLIYGHATIEGLAEGQYYLGVIVDPSNTIAETNENNNTACTPEPSFSIYSGNFDLSARSLDIVDCTLPGITANYRIANLGSSGTIPTNAFNTEFFLQQDDVTATLGSFRNTEPFPPAHESVGSFNLIWPTNLPSGIYYVKMRVDLIGEVQDFNRVNNEITGTPGVTVLNGNFDLIIANLNVTDAIGPSIAFNFRMPNFGTSGTIPARYITIRSYLTSGPTIDNTSHQIHEVLVESPVGPGDILDFSPQVLVSGVPDGNYYLGVVADALNAVNETDETNNTAFYSGIQIGSQNNYDLAVSNLTVNNAVGPNLSFAYTVANLGTHGTIPTNSFFTDIYLSTDATIEVGGADYLIRTSQNPWDLGVGTSVTVTVNEVTTSHVPNGIYYLGVVVDALRNITETNENNNIIVTPTAHIQIGSVPDPNNFDLAVTNLTVNDAVGPEISCLVEVVNNGTVGTIASNSFTTKYYLSTDAVITNSDYQIYSFTNPLPVGPGRGFSANPQIAVSSVPDGNYFLGVIVDADNAIIETNENNNTLATPTAQIQIQAATGNNFDLSLSDLNITDWIGPEIRFTFKIHNNGTRGTIPLNTFAIDTYLSTDANITNSDYLVGQYYNRADIGPGVVLYADETINPSGIPNGNYYLGIVLDPLNNITETNETNNQIVSTTAKIQIGITGVEDEVQEIPNGFKLYQNYPNPFNPSTKIGYTLKVAGYTTLKVYNLLGTEITTLVNGYKLAGSYVEKLHATSLPSGVYFYRLQLGGYSATKKFVLIK